MPSRPQRTSLLALLSSGLAAFATAHDPIDLGTLPGYTASRAKDINERGDVVGQAVRLDAEPVEQAVLWDRTHGGRYVLEALPALPGLVRGDARGFANGRAPIGFSYVAGPGFSLFRAVVWREDPSGEHVPLDLVPPPGFTDATALAANARGQIAGAAQNPLEVIHGSTVQHAVLWRPEHGNPNRPEDPPEYEVCDLGVPDGFDASGATGINEPGDVAGTARRLESDGSGGLLLRSVVVVWRKPWQHRRCVSAPIVLPSRPELPLNQNPAINERGDVVAQADRRVTGQPVVSRPLVWTRSGGSYTAPVELPLPEGFTDAYATDVNASGHVLGTAQVRSSTGALQASSAVVWRRCHRHDSVVSLLANPPGTTLTAGAHLNDRGDAVGSAPLPQPGSSGGLLWRGATSRRGHDGDDDDDCDDDCDDDDGDDNHRHDDCRNDDRDGRGRPPHDHR